MAFQQPALSFLSLPLKIRLLICDYALLSPHRFLSRFKSRVKKWNAPGIRRLKSTEIITPALLRTCKSIYHEARVTLYSKIGSCFVRLSPI